MTQNDAKFKSRSIDLIYSIGLSKGKKADRVEKVRNTSRKPSLTLVATIIDSVTTFDSSSIHLSFRFIKINQWHSVLSRALVFLDRAKMEAKSAGIVQGWNVVDSSDFLSSSPWTRFFVPEPRSRIFSGSLTVDPLFFCPRPSLPTTSFTHAPLCISRMDLGSVTKSRFTTRICASCRSDEQWTLLWPTHGPQI